jgi:hypothetical protein
MRLLLQPHTPPAGHMSFMKYSHPYSRSL